MSVFRSFNSEDTWEKAGWQLEGILQKLMMVWEIVLHASVSVISIILCFLCCGWKGGNKTSLWRSI